MTTIRECQSARAALQKWRCTRCIAASQGRPIGLEQRVARRGGRLVCVQLLTLLIAGQVAVTVA